MSWRPGLPELIIILVILVFLFGASRLKDIAKAVGDSIREFKKATSEPSKEESTEEAVFKTAKKLGINTEGKDLSEVVDEIAKKAQKD